jgi:hypothetical protein
LTGRQPKLVLNQTAASARLNRSFRWRLLEATRRRRCDEPLVVSCQLSVWLSRQLTVRQFGLFYNGVLMRNMTAILLGVTLLCSGGCTILRGDKQKVKFQTDPPGAMIEVDKVQKAAPAEFVLKRKQKHQVAISSVGYRTIHFDLQARWDGGSIVSFMLPGGSFIWLPMDTVSGADRNFDRMALIRLEATTDPNLPPLKLVQHKGKLYTEEEYQKIKRKEAAETQPTTQPAAGQGDKAE